MPHTRAARGTARLARLRLRAPGGPKPLAPLGPGPRRPFTAETPRVGEPRRRREWVNRAEILGGGDSLRGQWLRWAAGSLRRNCCAPARQRTSSWTRVLESTRFRKRFVERTARHLDLCLDALLAEHRWASDSHASMAHRRIGPNCRPTACNASKHRATGGGETIGRCLEMAGATDLPGRLEAMWLLRSSLKPEASRLFAAVSSRCLPAVI